MDKHYFKLMMSPWSKEKKVKIILAWNKPPVSPGISLELFSLCTILSIDSTRSALIYTLTKYVLAAFQGFRHAQNGIMEKSETTRDAEFKQVFLLRRVCFLHHYIQLKLRFYLIAGEHAMNLLWSCINTCN